MRRTAPRAAPCNQQSVQLGHVAGVKTCATQQVCEALCDTSSQREVKVTAPHSTWAGYGHSGHRAAREQARTASLRSW